MIVNPISQEKDDEKLDAVSLYLDKAKMCIKDENVEISKFS